MKLFGLTVASTVFADVTQYNDANGNVITIDPGCPTLWPKNQDKDTVLPYWKRECPPLDLCYPNVKQHVGTKPYNAQCKVNGEKVVDSSCCSLDWDKGSYCYGSCQNTAANNLDGKSKVSWRCSCSKSKGCWWVNQGNNMSDLICTPCKAAQKTNWSNSGTQQADFNNQPTALGVNGKILSGMVVATCRLSSSKYTTVSRLLGKPDGFTGRLTTMPPLVATIILSCQFRSAEFLKSISHNDQFRVSNLTSRT